MSFLRQLGSGFLYAVVSVVLVAGGLSLALAEGDFQSAAPASPTAEPSLQPPSPTPAIPTASVAITQTPFVATATHTPSATSSPLIFTATSVPPSAIPYVPPRPTSTRSFYPTSMPCGPYAGWLLNYVVQPGDTLFHIATQYRTTVKALQVANCKPTTVIFPGERLWVPNIPTVTAPSVTLIPTFPSPTLAPTEPEPPTMTPIPTFTDTAVPTDTTVPNQ